ncbi:MAG: hypothetical protein OHK0012_04830 [Synechococcales cyanobacterium]
MSSSEAPKDPSQVEQFLYPYTLSSANLPPAQMLLDANLQEFSQRVTIICGLESNGKLSPLDAYQQIKALWKQLQAAKRQLESPPEEI